jgi:hypothetical protein
MDLSRTLIGTGDTVFDVGQRRRVVAGIRGARRRDWECSRLRAVPENLARLRMNLSLNALGFV